MHKYLELEQSVKVKGSGFDPIRVSLNKLSISTAKRERFFQRTALIICLWALQIQAKENTTMWTSLKSKKTCWPIKSRWNPSSYASCVDNFEVYCK